MSAASTVTRLVKAWRCHRAAAPWNTRTKVLYSASELHAQITRGMSAAALGRSLCNTIRDTATFQLSQPISYDGPKHSDLQPTGNQRCDTHQPPAKKWLASWVASCEIDMTFLAWRLLMWPPKSTDWTNVSQPNCATCESLAFLNLTLKTSECLSRSAGRHATHGGWEGQGRRREPAAATPASPMPTQPHPGPRSVRPTTTVGTAGACRSRRGSTRTGRGR